MLCKTGLLILTNPIQIGTILPLIQKQVKKTLYIHLLTALSEPFGNFHINVFTSCPKFSQTIFGIYSQAAIHCNDLDVRVLLSGLKYKNLAKIQTHQNIDLVIFDKIHSNDDIDGFIQNKIANLTKGCNVLSLDSGTFENLNVTEDNITCNHAVLGGTFDRLHTAHKLLLSEAALRATRMVTVGVTTANMLQSKTLWELIESVDTRMANVKDFLDDVCPELQYNVVPISDPFGPSTVDSTMDLIVVSEETLKGGRKINEIREQKNLNKLDVVPVNVIAEPFPGINEESKISSSTNRIRLLGTLLKPNVKKNLPEKPYVIGLTGGVASGKSGVAKWLSFQGAHVIDCDKVGHEVYKPGRPCHGQLVQHFGKRVLTSEGEINRQVLGSIVFDNPEALKKLNSLVWPAIAEEVNRIIGEVSVNVVVVEAAVLLSAGWEKYCHEVWTTVIPREEAIKRLQSRNGLSEEQATARINAQPSNTMYVDSANVVFCSLWEPEFTKKQVDKAWDLLQERIPSY